MSNPVISNFFPPEGTTYYKPDGSVVRPDEELHIHADGTIMTEHSEIGGTQMSDTSVIVTTSKPIKTVDSSIAGGLTPLDQDELMNNAQSARTQRAVRRTLKRLSSTRTQKYPAYRQRLQSQLVKLQNQVATQKELRSRINQARRGQIEPNVLQRQMYEGRITTPIRQPISDTAPDMLNPNLERPTRGGRPISEEARRLREGRRMSTGGTVTGVRNTGETQSPPVIRTGGTGMNNTGGGSTGGGGTGGGSTGGGGTGGGGTGGGGGY